MDKELSLFDKFYNENKHKLSMKKAENYPLNYKKSKQWVNSQCDLESQDFADSIIKSTLYVSYGTFIKRLTIICESYKKSYSLKQHRGTEYILILPFKVRKSNMWISLLAYKFLRPILTGIAYDITNVYNMRKNPKSHLYNKKIRCIICDDCAYTGHQLSFIASFNYDTLNHVGKTLPPSETSIEWIQWYDNMITAAKAYENSIPLGQFSVDLIIPYMSNLAQIRLKKISYVKIPEMCRIFPIFSRQINVERVPTHVLNEFRKTFQFHKDISAIYFDHKIADAVSTFHKVYLLAPLFNCSLDRSLNFIEGCPDMEIPKDINMYAQYNDLEQLLGDNACPKTFYRSIIYTLNNKLVDTNMMSVELFKISTSVKRF